ncbi:MAG: hypothetical protein J6A98_03550 [Clostridia bacterium]|nr:hypothetical protein [Clostridia bacterium]
MNKLWTYLMILSIAALIFVQPQSVISEMTNASMDVINLCITLLAVYTIWLGILEIVDATGLGARLARLLRPLIRKLFKINDPETEKYIALNMSSNILGLGNASTPMGIKAMKRLDDGSGKITAPMIMLLIVNATSIQLFPTTVVGLRAQAGSVDPTSIILPTILGTIITCITAITATKVCEKIFFKKRVKNGD